MYKRMLQIVGTVVYLQVVDLYLLLEWTCGFFNSWALRLLFIGLGAIFINLRTEKL